MEATDTVRKYVEEVTLSLEQMGLPRTAGRVLAYLLVCDPPEQPMHDLADALQLSKSSVSTATQTLVQFKFIERISLPGERRDFYRVEGSLWHKLMYRRLDEVRAMREIAERGLDLLADAPDTRTTRLREMHELFSFWEKEMPALLDRWEAERSGDA